MAIADVKRGQTLRVILFGILLGVLCVAFWPRSSGNRVLQPRHVPLDGSTLNDLGNHTSFLRDSYSCSATKPCSNGACCGASGFCGYGPTYCGNGCLSQCEATAECGKFAEIPGKTCPLNTCCSEFGFVSDWLLLHNFPGSKFTDSDSF